MISLALSLALASSGICNPLQKSNLELEARVGIDPFSPQLCSRIANVCRLFKRIRYYSLTSRNYSFGVRFGVRLLRSVETARPFENAHSFNWSDPKSGGPLLSSRAGEGNRTLVSIVV